MLWLRLTFVLCPHLTISTPLISSASWASPMEKALDARKLVRPRTLSERTELYMSYHVISIQLNMLMHLFRMGADKLGNFLKALKRN